MLVTTPRQRTSGTGTGTGSAGANNNNNETQQQQQQQHNCAPSGCLMMIGSSQAICIAQIRLCHATLMSASAVVWRLSAERHAGPCEHELLVQAAPTLSAQLQVSLDFGTRPKRWGHGADN
jgi:hypothetical protein